MSLYQCFFTLPSVLWGNVLAISAQLFPASRIFFKRCSSAGVQGVFVRLFFAGGPIVGEAILGSSVLFEEVAVGAAPEDMLAGVEEPGSEGRGLLFRDALEGETSDLTGASAVDEPVCVGDIPDVGATSARSPRLPDIG